LNGFVLSLGKLGISEKDHLVVYDSAGLGPACRAYWTFKVFGHEKISILNGGLPTWILNEYPVESGEPQYSTTTYSAKFQSQLVKSLDQVVAAIQSKSALIVDARPSGRYLIF
jgi:thiosulfate/3-mercaptopyruvate sulfurtransferase